MIEERIRSVFEQVFHCDAAQLGKDASPDTVSGWDSFGHMELVDALENAFQVTFATEDIAQMETLGRIEQILLRRGARP
jgi:acyl carrier protein